MNNTSGEISDSTSQRRWRRLVWLAVICCLCGACKPLQVNNVVDRLVPTNNREWTADMRKLATAEIGGDEVLIHNIRNCNYLTEKDFVVDYYDRTVKLSDVRSVDFIVVPFKNRAIAHTMLSFELADGSYLCVSVEIRIELGEVYSAILGASNQFELIYVLADERDLIRLRTRYRDAEVYIYPTVATAEAAQQLLVDVLERANGLAIRPEFYNTFTNNCTTNIVSHVNHLEPDKVPFGWKVLLPGFSAEYAYDLGLLDNRLPFAELTRLAYVNDLAAEHFDDPDFSKAVRSRRGEIAKAIAAASEPLINSENRSRTRARGGLIARPSGEFRDLD